MHASYKATDYEASIRFWQPIRHSVNFASTASHSFNLHVSLCTAEMDREDLAAKLHEQDSSTHRNGGHACSSDNVKGTIYSDASDAYANGFWGSCSKV